MLFFFYYIGSMCTQIKLKSKMIVCNNTQFEVSEKKKERLKNEREKECWWELISHWHMSLKSMHWMDSTIWYYCSLYSNTHTHTHCHAQKERLFSFGFAFIRSLLWTPFYCRSDFDRIIYFSTTQYSSGTLTKKTMSSFKWWSIDGWWSMELVLVLV